MLPSSTPLINAKTASYCKEKTKSSCSPERTFMFWHISEMKEPHSHLDRQLLPLKFIPPSPFLRNLSAEQEKYLSFAGWFLWEKKVNGTEAANALLHKNPPNNPIFQDFQLSVSSHFSRSNSRPRTELNLSWGKHSFA